LDSVDIPIASRDALTNASIRNKSSDCRNPLQQAGQERN
jgi:hypothetical protein